MRRKIIALCTALACTVPAAGAETAVEDWRVVDMLTQAVAGAMGRTAAPVDRRIKLARCPEQVAVTATDMQTLAVRCAPLGWRVRVAMTGPSGAPPASAGFARPAQSAPVIRRGDNVRVTIDAANFSISYAAIATEDGRVGETIALRRQRCKVHAERRRRRTRNRAHALGADVADHPHYLVAHRPGGRRLSDAAGSFLSFFTHRLNRAEPQPLKLSEQGRHFSDGQDGGKDGR